MCWFHFMIHVISWLHTYSAMAMHTNTQVPACRDNLCACFREYKLTYWSVCNVKDYSWNYYSFISWRNVSFTSLKLVNLVRSCDFMRSLRAVKLAQFTDQCVTQAFSESRFWCYIPIWKFPNLQKKDVNQLNSQRRL